MPLSRIAEYSRMGVRIYWETISMLLMRSSHSQTETHQQRVRCVVFEQAKLSYAEKSRQAVVMVAMHDEYSPVQQSMYPTPSCVQYSDGLMQVTGTAAEYCQRFELNGTRIIHTRVVGDETTGIRSHGKATFYHVHRSMLRARWNGRLWVFSLCGGG